MSITFEQITNAHRAAVMHMRAVADELARRPLEDGAHHVVSADALIAGAATLLIETAKQGALTEFAPVVDVDDPETPITFGTVWRGQRIKDLSLRELEWALDESTGKQRVPDHWRPAFAAALDRKRKPAAGSGG